MIIDSHCHYNLAPLHSEWRAHKVAAQKQGVCGAIVPGIDEASSLRGARLAASDPYFHYAIGIHPTTAAESLSETSGRTLEALLKQALPLAKPIAIGETGIDFFHRTTDSFINADQGKKQIRAFNAHIELAQQLKLPLIVHVRDRIENYPRPDSAYQLVLGILSDFSTLPPVILHCASGPSDYIRSAVEMGFYVSFAGNITYPSAKQLGELLALVPKERVLIETDAPYLPPQSHRGKVCEPWMITETEALVNELGVWSTQLLENTKRVFSLTEN